MIFQTFLSASILMACSLDYSFNRLNRKLYFLFSILQYTSLLTLNIEIFVLAISNDPYPFRFSYQALQNNTIKKSRNFYLPFFLSQYLSQSFKMKRSLHFFDSHDKQFTTIQERRIENITFLSFFSSIYPLTRKCVVQQDLMQKLPSYRVEHGGEIFAARLSCLSGSPTRTLRRIRLKPTSFL